MKRHILLAIIAFFAFAQTVCAQICKGNYNDSIIWTLDTVSGLLTIEGKGELNPWRKVTDATVVTHYNAYKKYISDIKVSEGITGIVTREFADYKQLKTVSLPQSLRWLGNGVFQGCTNLKTVNIPENIDSLGNNLFSWCPNIEYEIVNGIKYISNWAIDYDFYHFHYLNETVVTLREGTVGLTLPGLRNITEINLPQGLRYIGGNMFLGSKIKSILIPESVKKIGEFAFQCCNSLTTIIVAEGNLVYDSRENCNAIIETATNTLIAGCASTTIPNSVTKIKNYTFSGITLPSITIPKNVVEIEPDAILLCNGLSSIVVEEGNLVYDSRENCNAIIETATNTLIKGCRNTKIPNGITTIDKAADVRSPIVENRIIIPSSVTKIGSSGFSLSESDKIFCFAENPPVCTRFSFGYNNNNNNLYVPEEYVEAYSNAEVWKDFAISGLTSKTKRYNKKDIKFMGDGHKIKGIYKQTHYKRGEQPYEEFPFDIYKIVVGTDTTDVGNNTRLCEHKVLQLETFYVTESKERAGYIIKEAPQTIVKSDKNSYTNRWFCDMIDHKTIKNGTIVEEYYSKKFEPSDNYKNLKKIFATKPRKSNKFLGVWKCVNTELNMYKVYGKEHRLGTIIRKNYCDGNISTIEYVSKYVTIEGGNRCDIAWVNDNKYYMTYQYDGDTIVEIWERSSIEEITREFNNLIINN